MNEEEMARRIERLEEEIDTVKFSLRSLEAIRDATIEAIEQWKKKSKK